MKKIAVISAILEEPKECQEKFNSVVISITVVGTLEEINSLTGKLGNIDGVVVKTAIAKREI